MRYCTECGAQVEDGVRYCTSCGQPMESENYQSAGAGYQQPNTGGYSENYAGGGYANDNAPYGSPGDAGGYGGYAHDNASSSATGNDGSYGAGNFSSPPPPPRQRGDYGSSQEREPVSVGDFFGSTLLSCIPVVNLIVLIVWAVSAKKHSKRNWARSQLICLAIGVVVGFILIALLASLFVTLLEYLPSDFDIDMFYSYMT